MRAGLSAFLLLIWIFERVGALAQRLKNSAFLLHLIKTRQEFTSDVLKLIFFGWLSDDQS